MRRPSAEHAREELAAGSGGIRAQQPCPSSAEPLLLDDGQVPGPVLLQMLLDGTVSVRALGPRRQLADAAPAKATANTA
ncbi:hypothetical protein, partial [Streptomyces spectabilis]|uniref:hypothetical protein n=1 Tax=Streptomyces spectabilis TaxID=68270 RepID=UPI0033D4932B